MRIEKSELLEDLKKKLQRVAYDLWFNTLKGTDQLYVVEAFDLKTIEEDIAPEYRAASISEDKSGGAKDIKGNSDSMKLGQMTGLNISPQKNFSPKRKMFDLSNIRNFTECIVGDVFTYKNRIFLKIVFRAVIKNAHIT